MHDTQTDAPFVVNKQTLTPPEHGRCKPLHRSRNHEWKVENKREKTEKINTLDGEEIGVHAVALPFHTYFAYTGSHGKNVLIPTLEDLRSQAPEGEDTDWFDNSIQGWNDMLDRNEKLKEEATELEVISFDAGAEYSSTVSVETEQTGSNMFVFNLNGKIGLFTEFAISPVT